MHISTLSTCASALLLCSVVQATRFSKTAIKNARIPSFARTREQQQVLMKRGGTTHRVADPHARKHTINVTIGTPPQDLRLVLTPGLGDTIIPFWNAGICSPHPNVCGRFGTFNSSMSSTFENVSTKPIVEHKPSNIYTERYFKDTLGIEGTSIEGLEMMVTQYAFDRITQDYDALGVLGLGPPTSEFEAGSAALYPNFLEEMVRQNLSQTRAYSIWMDDIASSGGEVTFGSIDTGKFTSDMVVVPAMVSREDSAPAVQLFSLAYGPQAEVSDWTVTPPTPLLAILDNNEDEIILPNIIFGQIGNQMNVNLSAELNCSLVPEGAWLSFSFNFCYGPVINTSLSNLVYRTGRPDDEVCYWKIDSWGMDYAVLGEPFLRSAYAVYNWEANEIALAQATPNPNASNIVPITGPQIPGAVVVSSDGTYTCPAPIEGHPLPAVCQSRKQAKLIADRPRPIPITPSPPFINSSPEAKRQVIIMILTTVCVVVFLTPFMLLNALLFWGALSSGFFHLWSVAAGAEERPK